MSFLCADDFISGILIVAPGGVSSFRTFWRRADPILVAAGILIFDLGFLLFLGLDGADIVLAVAAEEAQLVAGAV